jgi:hypothetical protein
MPESNATILIPDISGFTEFMTTTELAHSSHAISVLIDSIVKAVGDEYEVSEIEGDAVLLIKKGPAPSQKEILDVCLKIFNGFHFQRKWMQQHTICPCGACQAIINLTLKFVVHHGPLAEIKVGRFIKHSGTDMIVAHRLLKNSINSNEYLLMTEKLMHAIGSLENTQMEWVNSSEEYASIGKVEYRFTLLDQLKKNVPDPPAPPAYPTDNTSYTETSIAANFQDVYMVLMNIPQRPDWMQSLQSVTQDVSAVFVGSTHHCTYDDRVEIISPLKMMIFGEGIVYAESNRTDGTDLSLTYEFVFKNTGGKSCSFGTRFMNANESSISKDLDRVVQERMRRMTSNLKAYCENMTSSPGH